MRLTIVRHGETEHNRGHLTLGRADVPLNDLGQKQAAAVGESFDTAPGAIYASPLRRARETAQAIAVAHNLDLVIEDDLIEMDVGEMEHLAYPELGERYPDFLRQWLSDDVAHARMPGGETLAEVQQRSWAVIQRLEAAHPGANVVIVTHNFVALTIICAAIGLPLSKFRGLRQALAAKTVIDFGERAPTLLQLNDVSHLVAAGLPTALTRAPRS